MAEFLSLEEEFLQSRRFIRETDLRYPLLRHRSGEPFDHLHVGLETVRFEGDTYTPDPNGTGAMIVPAMCAGGLEDLVAVTPKRFARRDKEALLLGWWNVGRLAPSKATLKVFFHPHDWLKSGCTGVCFLDEGVVWDVLRHEPHLETETPEDGKRLRDLMRPPAYTGNIYVTHTPQLEAA